MRISSGRREDFEKMKAVIQRVSQASVTIDGEIKSSIGMGMLILLGISTEDDVSDISKMVAKISRLRIFNDSNGKMNLSCSDVNGEYLVVSQFTLLADVSKGNRPSYIKAAAPDKAIPLYEEFLNQLKHEMGGKVESGEFGADMKVELLNDGPVTIQIDTRT
jgi:D-tyrosyl-tRNA(Tyr) deacylase